MTQEEVDSAVNRIRLLVAHYDNDGHDPALDKLRAAYLFFHKAPGDNMGFVLLLNEIEDAEKAAKSTTGSNIKKEAT